MIKVSGVTGFFEGCGVRALTEEGRETLRIFLVGWNLVWQNTDLEWDTSLPGKSLGSLRPAPITANLGNQVNC